MLPWRKRKGSLQIALKRGEGSLLGHVAHPPQAREKGATLAPPKSKRESATYEKKGERGSPRPGRLSDGPPSLFLVDFGLQGALAPFPTSHGSRPWLLSFAKGAVPHGLCLHHLY